MIKAPSEEQMEGLRFVRGMLAYEIEYEKVSGQSLAKAVSARGYLDAILAPPADGQPEYPLLGVEEPPQHRPVLTLENREKWSDAWVVHPDGRVESAEMWSLDDYAEPGERAYGETMHVYNPKVVARMCEAWGWDFDEVAMDTLVGRWIREAVDPTGKKWP